MQLVLLANIWLIDWLYCVFNYYWCFYPSINNYTHKYLLLLTNIDNIYNKTTDLYLNDLMIIFKLLLQATRHDTPRTLLIRIRPCSSCPSYVVIFTSFIFKGNSSSLWEVSLVLHQRAGYQLSITDWTLIKCQGYILVLSQFCGGGVKGGGHFTEIKYWALGPFSSIYAAGTQKSSLAYDDIYDTAWGESEYEMNRVVKEVSPENSVFRPEWEAATEFLQTVSFPI